MSIVSFGESMLSYKPAPAAPDGSVALTGGASVMVQAVAGAELNVAVAATLVGESCEWVSVLPAGPMGQMVVEGAAQAGLKLNEPHVKFVPNASLATLHVVDDGSGPHPHYQRSHSAFCTQLDGKTFDRPALLRGAKWLHVTTCRARRWPVLGMEGGGGGSRRGGRECRSTSTTGRRSAGSMSWAWSSPSSTRHAPHAFRG